MKAKVGNRELIEHVTLLIPKGEDAWINFIVDSWEIRINVILDSDEEDTSYRYSFTGKVDYAELRFFNFGSKSNTSSSKSIHIGTTKSNNKIFMTLFSQKSGELNKFDISFLKEAGNE